MSFPLRIAQRRIAAGRHSASYPRPLRCAHSHRKERPMSSIAIQITHDFTCPWCARGEARERRGIARSGVRVPLVVTSRAFEVDPARPREGTDRLAHRMRRLGSRARAQRADAATRPIRRPARGGRANPMTFTASTR
ncbi:hypothetical protein OIV55_16010 [Burkholderia pseudomallei]|nr:hypothetical protein [Burkholderia pseudomallei]MCW0156122.1 hypothetical protein [Burkholderia pseudomallei]MCW0169450.1 hypothetical protein [Burkholderia pseudomallei]